MLEQLEADIKTAMLAGDKTTAEALRNVKSVLQSEAINSGTKEQGLSDEQIQKVLARESKKRTEAAELYIKAGATDRAQAELAEKALIEKYLPEQMDEAAVAQIVKQKVAEVDNPTMAQMGQIIGAVRAETGAGADGALIARLVKEQLEQK